MLATQVLPEDTLDDATTQDESEIIGHLVTDTNQYEIKRGENKIGRDPFCSIVIENCTISKLHAIIESDGRDETFIYDCGSTNLTRLKKKKLKPHCRYKLDDKSDIVLGNIVATFKLVPEINSSEGRKSKIISVNSQALDELDDIFDLPTQVNISGPSTSRDVLKPSFDIKTLSSVLYDRKQTVSHDIRSDSELENSEIFNLSTQCQLQTQDDCDKIKLLLNDGQDDVLCNFMSTLPPKCDYGSDIDIFDAPTQVEAPKNIDLIKLQVSAKKNTLDQEKGDSVITQKFDEITKKEAEPYVNHEKIKDTKEAQSDRDRDEILTQELPLPNNQAEKSVSEISLVDLEEDSILTQNFDEVTKKETDIYSVHAKIRSTEETQMDRVEDEILTREFVLPNNQDEESVLEVSLVDLEEDLVVTQKFDEATKGDQEKAVLGKTGGKIDNSNAMQSGEKSQGMNSTQIFQLVNFSENVKSYIPISPEDKDGKSAENSGDETISDLEIENENNFTIKEVKFQPEIQIEESLNSNDSYIFEIDPKQPDRDSDATNCEIKPLVKTEPFHAVFEETQVLTSTPPCNLQDNISAGKRSPSSRCCSPLSLEMPSTQDLESTMCKFLDRENKVGNESEPIDSPLERIKDNTGSVDPSPAKKPKTCRGISKLWQMHDIAQIQPTRTRYSLRTLDTNKQSCRRSARERKSNPEITPYLIRCRKKTETPKENRRVLRRRQSERFRSGKRKSRTDLPVIAFTGFENESLKNVIYELGGEKTNDVLSASVVVANKVRRTVKFLCAIGLSLPITSPEWLSTSKKEMKFLNPRNFILKDEEAENKWAFSLRNSLEISKRTKLLEGYSVFATKNTKPPLKDLLAIVECCGGTPIVTRPTVWPRKTIIISCEEDKEAWPPLKVRNIKLVHYEFILTGVLRQKIDFKSYSLR